MTTDGSGNQQSELAQRVKQQQSRSNVWDLFPEGVFCDIHIMLKAIPHAFRSSNSGVLVTSLATGV